MGTRPALRLTVFALLLSAVSDSGAAFDWAPTDQELEKYRASWNPHTHGATLTVNADTVPKGRLVFRGFVFSEIGNGQFENQLTTQSSASPFNPIVVTPRGVVLYGLADHLTVSASLSTVYWKLKDPPPPSRTGPDSGSGLGDASLMLKYRPVLQDPDSWRPTISLFSQLVLPTSKWAGTPPIPGGFEPLGHLPATRFGTLAFTEGLLVRKNLDPFRITGGVYYTYSPPGSLEGMLQYGGDLLNVRLALEHVLSEKHGFGYTVELATLHGLPYRLDGHDLNTAKRTFWVIGIQPTLEYRFLEYEGGARLVGAAGILFTVAGQNDLDAIYPNASLKYFWAQE